MNTQPIEQYHTKFEVWRKGLQEEYEDNLSESLALSLLYERAKRNPLSINEFYTAIKEYDRKRFDKYPGKDVSSCVYLEEGDLVLDFGETHFFIEGAEEEIKTILYNKAWKDCDENFKYEEYKDEYCFQTATEQLANKEFDLIDFATSNLDRWEVAHD